ncbi:MAG: superoxide dismutase [Candidatus Pacebacteria bacterium]|nr:superoxide dismutase [Candidatus Paceibacterota bacterium]
MHTYEAKTFTIPTLEGISARSIEEHLGLYQGYVKNFNAMSNLIVDLAVDSEKNAHALSEIIRRRSFEFGGMRLHELYFAQLEGGATPFSADSALSQALTLQFGSVEVLVQQMKGVALMRGPGWANLYFDQKENMFHLGFSGEQHQGHFATLPIIIALDVWEHAYLLDYGAAGKAKYVDAFFKNLNWSVVENRLIA